MFDKAKGKVLRRGGVVLAVGIVIGFAALSSGMFRTPPKEIPRTEAQLALEARHRAGIEKLAAIIEEKYGAIEDDFDKAIAIRNDVYRTVRLERTPSGYQFDDFADVSRRR